MINNITISKSLAKQLESRIAEIKDKGTITSNDVLSVEELMHNAGMNIERANVLSYTKYESIVNFKDTVNKWDNVLKEAAIVSDISANDVMRRVDNADSLQCNIKEHIEKISKLDISDLKDIFHTKYWIEKNEDGNYVDLLSMVNVNIALRCYGALEIALRAKEKDSSTILDRIDSMLADVTSTAFPLLDMLQAISRARPSYSNIKEMFYAYKDIFSSMYIKPENTVADILEHMHRLHSYKAAIVNLSNALSMVSSYIYNNRNCMEVLPMADAFTKRVGGILEDTNSIKILDCMVELL